MISEGFWNPGDRLPPQRELATSLDVGLSTLREALQSLQTMGVLEMRHGDGTYLVESPSHDLYSHMFNVSMAMGKPDLEMLFEARGVLETGFAYYAAERATGEQIEELFQILEQQLGGIKNNNRELTYALDLAFHKKIAEIANNEFLQEIVGSLFETLEEVLQILPQTIEGWRWHREVAEHIRNHEPMKASESMRTLVIASGTRLLPYLNGNRDH